MTFTIKQVQEALIARGYDVGPDGADGRGGANTKRALETFEDDNFLPRSGSSISEYTLNALFPEARAPKERKTVMNNILGGLFSGLFKNLLNWQLVQSYIRSAIIAAGTAIGLDAYLGQDVFLTVVGAVMVIIGAFFGALSGNQKAKALEVVKAVDAAPDVTVISAKDSPTDKPIVKTTN